MRIYGDRAAPGVPSMTSLPNYVTSQTVSLDWSDSSDLPGGSNWGTKDYQLGAFDSASATEPLKVYPWTATSAYSANDLEDGQTYYFRSRARDNGGWISDWSNYATTMIDRTPPTAPQIIALPEYTKGTSVSLSWTTSADYGSGMRSYSVQWSTKLDFSDGGIHVVNHPGTSRQYNGLTSGTTYYYILAANDNALLRSGPSAVAHTTIDADPPTKPVMMSEPPYTKGEANNFSWHPSMDYGVGVEWYKIQVATTGDFQAGTIVYDRFVTDTFANFDGLEDNTRYYARVKAIDEFLYESEWSDVEWSIQDYRGPGELGLTPLMEYLPDGPVWLEWEGAEDDGSGVAYYEVLWSTDPDFEDDVHSRNHVLGQSFQVPDLASENTWYFKVRSYDSLGNPGEEETTFTTIDSQPPTQPEIEQMEEFTGGNAAEVSWSASTDPLAGLDHYILNVYTSQDRVGLAFTIHTVDTSFVVPGLADGMKYYYEVVAVDGAGNRIASALIHSTQDNSGPETPSLVPLGTYQDNGLFRVEWGTSSDDNGGGVEYEVQWAENVLFTNGIHTSPWLTGTNYQVHDTGVEDDTGKVPLDDGTYYVRVRARDMFQQTSSWGNSIKVIVDTTPPEAPEVAELPEFSGGTTIKVSWSEVDDGSGMDVEYRVMVSENETGDPIMTTPWTKGLSVDVSDLEPYMTYYFRVVSRDHMGWISEPSEAKETTIDIDGPKVTPTNGGYFGKADIYITGDAEDKGCGVEMIELSFDDGLSWVECTYAGEKWSYPKEDLPGNTNNALVRGRDKGGNIGPSALVFIDEDAPAITVLYPPEDSRITGPTQITGSIQDENLVSYSVYYMKEGSADWTALFPSQSTQGFSGILATWSPSGLSGGDYYLKIEAVDALGQVSEKVLNVTIAGANLNIDPAQITFSNHHPFPDEKVKVMVTISNFGDSPADDLTVEIYDGKKLLLSQSGVDVPANGIVVVTTELKASGTHTITARATSSLYDSGDMSQGAVLEVSEKEMVLENLGGIFGLLALILAIVAIILIFVLGGKRDKRPEEEKQPPEDEEKKEGEPEKQEDVERAPPITMPKTETPKPALPSPPTPPQERPRLPGAGIGPATTPGGRPVSSQPQPPPQLKPAPPTGEVKAPVTPPPVSDTSAKATYTPPQPHEQHARPEVQLPDNM
ncbi:MAG: fibronectin type III domain-containing protein [Thermoplasmatota archaeon]